MNFLSKKNKIKIKKKSIREMKIGGFTIIEVVVAISIFMVVMVVAAGALLSIIDANRKAHQLKIVMDNLNFALEEMARNIRVGSSYACNNDVNNPMKCDGDLGTLFGYQDAYINQRIVYSFDKTKKQLSIALQNGTAQSVTSDQVKIDNMHFWLFNVNVTGHQPRLLMTIQGHAGEAKYLSTFNLQTTITQR